MQLYLLTFPNGKCYVGQTTFGLDVRVRMHVKDAQGGSSLLVHKAWRKYGEPMSEVLAAASNQDELNQLERQLIEDHGTLMPNGYNMVPGGRGGNLRISPNTAEHNAKIAAAWTPERRAAQAERARKVKARAPWTEERKRAHGDKIRKNFATRPELREQKRQAWLANNPRKTA